MRPKYRNDSVLQAIRGHSAAVDDLLGIARLRYEIAPGEPPIAVRRHDMRPSLGKIGCPACLPSRQETENKYVHKHPTQTSRARVGRLLHLVALVLQEDPVLHPEHLVPVYLAEHPVAARLLPPPGRRGEDHARHHGAAVLLCLHAAGRGEHASHLRVRATHR